jgi:hypothetical protein
MIDALSVHKVLHKVRRQQKYSAFIYISACFTSGASDQILIKFIVGGVCIKNCRFKFNFGFSQSSVVLTSYLK